MTAATSAPSLRYSIDSSALIHGWRRAYPPKNFGALWDRLETLALLGDLIASIEVFHELEKKDDDLFRWCKDRRDSLFVEIDNNIQPHLAHIMGTYPRLVDTVKGRSGADPFVIALARMNTPRLTVVSEETFGRADSPKIPNVCQAENIRCIRLLDLIQEQDWTF